MPWSSGRLSITRVAAGLGGAWNTANDTVLEAGRRLLIQDPTRLEDVPVISVDEHVWSHAGHGSKYVTVIIDLTPIRTSTSPVRLLDMVPGCSKQVFKTWLGKRLIRAANECSRPRSGIGGCSGDPLYGIRRILHTGAELLTSRQTARLETVFACEAHVEVEVTWGAYQRILAAYRDPDRAAGKRMMQAVIASLASGVPEALKELITLGRTLKRGATDVPAFFEPPGSSNGPTEAINGSSQMRV